MATFEEVAAGQTRVVFRQLFNTAEECRKVKAFAGVKNEENLDRLEEELRKMRV